MNTDRLKFTPPEIARKWGISVDKILTWIRSGELKAINAATRLGGRPRYLISLEALDSFERSRTVAEQPSSKPRNSKRSNQDVIDFF